MATPRFGADRIKDIPPLNLLDALYAQGMPENYLRQLLGMTTPEITSFLLRDNQDRGTLDRAVNMAQGKELETLGKTTDDYSKLRVALENRGGDLSGYKGAKDVNELATWANSHFDTRVVDNAVATALPHTTLLGGRSIGDEQRRGVTLFSNPQPGPTGDLTPTTTRGIPTAGGQGVRGQTVPDAADLARGAAPAPMPVAGKSPAATPTGTGTTPTPGGGPNNTPTPPAQWTDDSIKTWLKQNLGADSWFIDIPQVWDAMSKAVRGGTDPDAAFKATDFYQHTASKSRLWYQKEREDPPSAAADVAQQTEAVTNQAQAAGITLDPERAAEIAKSYLRYGWTATDLQRAIGAEWHYDPNTKNQAAAVTKMKQDARSWLVPLSDQALQTWGQGLISGTTNDAQWQQYLRDNAKSMMPQLSDLIDAHAGDPTFTVDHFADPYKQTASSLLGVDASQVDLNDPKWRKALDQVDPKTGQRRIMSLSEWSSTIKSDPTYGYDKSANGISEGMSLAASLKSSMGL